MPRTYEPIASQTLGSDTALVAFTGIPQTYTDLTLVIYATSARSANVSLVFTYLNNDSSSIYSRTRIWTNTSSVFSDRNTGDSTCYIGEIPGNSSSTRGVSISHFMSYSNTNVFKTVLSRNGHYDTNAQANLFVNLWRSTAAISSLYTYNEGASNFKSGSTFSLYGIKAA